MLPRGSAPVKFRASIGGTPQPAVVLYLGLTVPTWHMCIRVVEVVPRWHFGVDFGVLMTTSWGFWVI